MFIMQKNYQKRLDRNLKKRFANPYKFPNHNISRIIFCEMAVYPY